MLISIKFPKGKSGEGPPNPFLRSRRHVPAGHTQKTEMAPASKNSRRPPMANPKLCVEIRSDSMTQLGCSYEEGRPWDVLL